MPSSQDWLQIAPILQYMIAYGDYGDIAKVQAEVSRQLGYPVDTDWQQAINIVRYMAAAGQGYAVPMTWELQRQLGDPRDVSTSSQPSAPGENLPDTVGGELTSEQRSAKANLEQFLSDYGLQSLGDFVWQEYLNNIPVEQIMLDIRDRPEYEARFPAMKALGEKGHAMSENEYIQYEKQVTQIMHAVGFDPAFYDQPSDFAGLLENELSINEVAERIQNQYRRVHDTAPEVRQAFADYFGIEGDNALAMTFLDPDRALPVLEKMASTATFGGLGATQGFQIGAELAGTAAGRGVTAEQAQQGFSQLGELRPLLRGTISEGTNLSDEEAAAAMFDLAVGARTAFTRHAEERQARFAGSTSGGALAINQGQIGLGTAPQRGLR